ncbi:MAG: hypothetical protein QM608_07795 [Caulobacter sp.]
MTTDDLHALETCADAVARNALALKLADARTPGLAEVLARLIQRPDLAKTRGTLVHALGMLDCAPHAALLVDLAITGGFEVAHEAVSALERVEGLAEADVRRVRARLESARAAGAVEDWRQDLLDEAWVLFG